MAEFSKASFILSSACHLQERGGGHCVLLSCYTKKALSWRVEKGTASSAKSHTDAWMERPPEDGSSQPPGGDLWLQPRQQVANCLQCSFGCTNGSTKPCEGGSWTDPKSLWTVQRWMMNGYFGNITNTVIYIHDGLIPEGLLEWAHSTVLWSFRVWTEWKTISKTIPSEVQRQEGWALYKDNLLFN